MKGRGFPDHLSDYQFLKDDSTSCRQNRTIIMFVYGTRSSRGFYLVATGAESPFALGKWVTSPEDEPRHKHRVGFSGVNDIDTQGSRGAVPVVLEV